MAGEVALLDTSLGRVRGEESKASLRALHPTPNPSPSRGGEARISALVIGFVCALFLSAHLVGAEPKFPELTGQIVDNAGLLSAEDKAAILAAMSITDELFRERTTARQVEEGIRELGSEVRHWLPPAKRGEATD